MSGAGDGNLIHFRDDTERNLELDSQSRFLDLGDPRIQSALIVTKHVLSDMRDTSKNESFRLVVVLLPTKERVYRNLLKQSGYIGKYPRLEQAIDQEDLARTKIVEMLSNLDIESLDLLPELETEINSRDLFSLTDPHPNKDGYSVIARVVNSYLGASR